MAERTLQKVVDCTMYVPVETLRRHAIGECGSRPGPPTVLTEEQEDTLAKYLIQMWEMEFGLRRETVMEMAYEIADKQEGNILSRMKQLKEHGSKDFRGDIQS